MRKTNLIFLFLCFSVLAFAKKPRLPPSGVQGDWMIVTQIDAKGNMDDVPAGSLISFDLAAKSIRVSAGCNTLVGVWEEKKKQAVKKINLAGTKMACDPDLMKAEDLLAKNMAKVTLYKFNGSMLELYKGKKLLLVLRRA
ncbi:MAG: hypothetical protein RI894_1495 [Bacteroidota bacterium]|jgi:heat shock protein HslJ